MILFKNLLASSWLPSEAIYFDILEARLPLELMTVCHEVRPLNIRAPKKLVSISKQISLGSW